MASKIQLSRGSLKAYGVDKLARGELFWVPNNVSNNSENDYRKDTELPWDEGTLYVGWPSLEGESEDSQLPLAIGGSRAYTSLNYKGKISKSVHDINDPMFDYVRVGDFFIFEEDAGGGDFRDHNNFKKEDILLIIKADYDIAADGVNDIGKAKTVDYIKIRTGSGDASAITFDKTNTNFDADNVQSALEELEYEKLSYRGTISSTEQLLTISPHIGSLYLNTTDNISYTGYDESGNEVSVVAQKGDFVIYHGSKDNGKLAGKRTGWEVIPSGYTDAVEIDYSPNDKSSIEGSSSVLSIIKQETSTFDNEHKQGVEALTNVKEAIDFLLLNKAQLDSHGKVPLSQLHDTVLGAMQYRGTWSPIIDETGEKNDIGNQREWPTDNTDNSESTEKGPFQDNNRPGDYYIVKCNPSIKNIQYIDKTSLKNGATQGSTNPEDYDRVIELNNGDWIVYSTSVYTADETDRSYHWEKIDNTDRISAVNFTINGVEQGNYAVSTEGKELSLVGSPKLEASHKIVLINNGNDTIEIAGTHLVDQRVDDPSIKNRIPRYYDDLTNTIENSTIENIAATDDKKAETHTHSNFYVGEAQEHYDQYNYGNIYIFPHIEYDENNSPYEEDSVIQYKIKVLDDETNETVETSTNLRAPEAVDGESDVILPNKSSTIIGKLEGITLIKDRITKSTADGYIDSSSIQEHMRAEGPYSDENVVSVEFKANDVIAKHFNTEAVIFASSAEVNENGELAETITSSLAKNDATSQSIVNYLPATAGILINNYDIENLISGTPLRLSLFGPAYTPLGAKTPAKSNTLQNSLIYQTDKVNKLLSILKHNRDAAAAENYENLYTGKDSIVVETDMVVGQVDENGTVVPKSLAVTKNFIMGNNDTVRTTVWSNSEAFRESSQYRNALTEEEITLKDVDVALPSVSGVLLTDNSRIDGHEWRM